MNTPFLNLPLIAEAQTGKYIAHNQAITVLEIVAAGAILDRDLTDPPGSPAEGAAYIPAATATGAWTGLEGRLVVFVNGAWFSVTPQIGLRAWLADEQIALVYTAGGWANQATVDFRLPVIRPAGTSRVLTLADNGALIVFDQAVACALTLPQASTEALPEGFQVLVRNRGGGALSLTLQGSDTVVGGTTASNPAVPTSVILETAGASNEWLAVGDLT